MHIKCNDHGATTWTGDVVCAACGAIHRASRRVDGELVYASATTEGRCTCGAPLLPSAARHGEEFTARIACAACVAAAS